MAKPKSSPRPSSNQAAPKSPTKPAAASTSSTTAVPPRPSKKGGRPGPRPISSSPSRAPVKRGAQAAFQAKKQRQRMLTYGAIALVVVVVLVFVVVKVAGGGGKSNGAEGTVPAAAMQQVTSVPLSTLSAAAHGFTLLNYPTAITDTPLMSNGQPEFLYVGAEYCPYCAAERRAMVMALSKFGTFSGLHTIKSSSTDVYPSTPTFTFYGSTYTSQYVTFTPVESETVTGKALQKLTAAQNNLLNTYDKSTTGSSGGIPFLDAGNYYTSAGASFLPTAMTGKSFSYVASQIANSGSAIARNEDAAAGVLISEICHMTNGAPSTVCSAFPNVILGT